MNKYANCLYEYIIENWFSGVTAEADYREAQASRDRAEKALFAVLPPEQEALFCTYLEEETALQAQYGIDLAKQKIVMDEPIKAYGSYELKAKLGYEVSGTIYVMVVEER